MEYSLFFHRLRQFSPESKMKNYKYNYYLATIVKNTVGIIQDFSVWLRTSSSPPNIHRFSCLT